MSAVMGIRPVSRKGAPVPATVAGPVTQARVVRAEWTKLRALRSTWWCGLTAVVLIVAPPRRLTTRKGCEDTSMSFRTPVENPGTRPLAVVYEVIGIASVLIAGLYTSTRRAYLAELRDRAQRLEREHDQTSALAAAVERARIAREKHAGVGASAAVRLRFEPSEVRVEVEDARSRPAWSCPRAP